MKIVLSSVFLGVFFSSIVCQAVDPSTVSRPATAILPGNNPAAVTVITGPNVYPSRPVTQPSVAPGQPAYSIAQPRTVTQGPVLAAEPSDIRTIPGTASAGTFNSELRSAVLGGGTHEIYFPETGTNIVVSADSGVVTLSGTVLNRGQARNLEQRVQNILGITTVENQLKVATNAPGAKLLDSPRQ